VEKERESRRCGLLFVGQAAHVSRGGVPQEEATDADLLAIAPPGDLTKKPDKLELVESAHPDLGKLGVFWHTQGSGKSYSMAFLPRKFAGKSRPSSPFC
jgi:hypothetical protein